MSRKKEKKQVTSQSIRKQIKDQNDFTIQTLEKANKEPKSDNLSKMRRKIGDISNNYVSIQDDFADDEDYKMFVRKRKSVT